MGPRDFLLKRQENNEGVKECGWLECAQLSYLPFRQLSVGGHKQGPEEKEVCLTR